MNEWVNELKKEKKGKKEVSKSFDHCEKKDFCQQLDTLL